MYSSALGGGICFMVFASLPVTFQAKMLRNLGSSMPMSCHGLLEYQKVNRQLSCPARICPVLARLGTRRRQKSADGAPEPGDALLYAWIEQTHNN